MPERILIVRNDKLGDLVQTLPMAQVIKQQMPDAHVTFMVREYTAPLLGLSPAVDSFVLCDNAWKLGEIVKAFKSANADAVFFPAPRPKLVLASRLAGIPVRVGTAFRYYSTLFSHRIRDHRKTAEYHEAEYNVRMLSALFENQVAGSPPATRLVLSQDDLEQAKMLVRHERFAVLHVSTGGSTLSWSESRFTELGIWVAHALSLPLILTGLETDRKTLLNVRTAIAESGGAAELVIGTSLIQLAAILKLASLVVANGTGPGHLAAALDTPTVGVFPLARAISKERWGFRGPRVRNVAPVIQPQATCPKCENCVCMERIAVDEVKQAILELNVNEDSRNRANL